MAGRYVDRRTSSLEMRAPPVQYVPHARDNQQKLLKNGFSSRRVARHDHVLPRNLWRLQVGSEKKTIGNTAHQVCSICTVSISRSSAAADGPRDALSVGILSTAAQLQEQVGQRMEVI